MFNLPVPERAAHAAISLPTFQGVHGEVIQETQAADSAHSEAPAPLAAETGHSRISALFLERQNSDELFSSATASLSNTCEISLKNLRARCLNFHSRLL